MSATLDLVADLREAGQDFEWYPTTRRMIDAVDRHAGTHVHSLLDIGAGDGRVLAQLAERRPHAKLYGIEKSPLLQQQQPASVIPVGTDFFEQDLMGLPVDVVFCNPPYAQFGHWAARIIETAHAKRVYLVLPERWETHDGIADALKAREARAKVIHRDDFAYAERRARAVVHVICVTMPGDEYNERTRDPFDRWFDQHIDTFDRETPISESRQDEQRLSRLRDLKSIAELVAAYDEEWARMQENYKAIFRLDYALLKELGVDKNHVRDGLKERMQGLKHTYWHVLFDQLDVITSRLTTRTKQRFLDRLTGQTAIAFTEGNAYAVVLWAIKAANQYFDPQLVELFRALSTFDGVTNYKSNQRTWEKDGWRYNAEGFSHYALDYRIVLESRGGIFDAEWGEYDYPGKLSKYSHEMLDDVIAVFGNLGFLVQDQASRARQWASGLSKRFHLADGRVLFEVKAFKNGNLHFRFMPEAIKALNIEAARLLGWLRGPADVVTELGYTADEAAQFFGSNQRLGAGAVKLLAAASSESAVPA